MSKTTPTRKNMIFYLPKEYKVQLDRIARKKGVPLKRLVMDVMYGNVLMHEPEKMNIYPANKEQSESELAVAVKEQAVAINKLLNYIDDLLNGKED